MSKPLRIAVLLSGTGSTLQNLIHHQQDHHLPIEIVSVISSRPGVGGLEHAQKANLAHHVVQRSGLSEVEFSDNITRHVEASGAALVCMCGFLSKWTIPSEFENKVMNIHPALLPSFGGRGFYGERVHEAVLAAGCRVSGCTVHFADNVYDHGPIILQESVRVEDSDTATTLGARVGELERRYPEAIRLFAAGRLCVTGRRVMILK